MSCLLNLNSSSLASYTDDVNQHLHNKSGSHGVPNANLFNLCFSWLNEVQQISNASSREDYNPQIFMTVL